MSEIDELLKRLESCRHELSAGARRLDPAGGALAITDARAGYISGRDRE